MRLLGRIVVVCLFSLVAQAESVRTSLPCDFGATDNVHNGDVELAKKALSILEVSCKRCHGLGQIGGAAVMTDVMSPQLLIKDGMVNLAKPEESKIIKAMLRPVRPMPLDKGRLPDADIQLVQAWIADGLTDPTNTTPINDPILNHYQEVECIAHDQSKLEQKDAEYVRYCTLGHLKGKDFEIARAGITKKINTLTFANKPKAPVWVDKIGKVIRIDTRYYEPNITPHAWEKKIIPGYPYAYVSEDDKLYNFYVEKINKYAYSERAFVRCDWLVKQTGEDPVYSQILQLPKTQFEVERDILKVNVEKDILGGYAKRGSVARSGVTNYPRLLDKFEFDFVGGGDPGLYWRTYDFNGDKGTRNIYGFPFGPRILSFYQGWDEAKLFANKVFENDAGETIAQLPNGFQFYTIYDAKGNLVSEADPHIAIDKSGLYNDNKVRTAISCDYCHSGGVNQFDDDSVIRHMVASPGFTVDEVKAGRELFFSKEQRNEAFGYHAEKFKKAMIAIGLDGSGYLSPPGEPISNTFRKFEDYLTCQDLAWELGLKLPQLENYLQHSPSLARELGLSDCETGKLSRENYEHLFNKILVEFDLGFQVKVGGHVVVPVEKCKYLFSNKSGRTVKFTTNYGAADVVQINHGATKAYEFSEKKVGRVADLKWFQNGGWWTFNRTYDVNGCRTYGLSWKDGGVVLLAE